jgi:hypothetical protein
MAFLDCEYYGSAKHMADRIYAVDDHFPELVDLAATHIEHLTCERLDRFYQAVVPLSLRLLPYLPSCSY